MMRLFELVNMQEWFVVKRRGRGVGGRGRRGREGSSTQGQIECLQKVTLERCRLDLEEICLLFLFRQIFYLC